MSFRVVRSLAGWCGVVLCLAASSLVAASPAGAVAGYGDVADGRYYTEPVQWSVDNDVTGIDGNCFLPDAPVSRGEAAVYIWNMEGQPSAPAHSFVDVTDESQDAAVSWMSHNEITTGTSPTTFGPNTALTRAHLVTFLWRLDDKPAAPAHLFVDVHASWQQGSVSWAADREITTGTSPTTFDPDDTLKRAHLVTFLYRYQGEPEVMVDPASPECDPDAAPVDESAVVVPPSRALQTVSAGWFHSCGLRADNTLTCWGDNRWGQADAPAGAFQTVSAGWEHSCGLRADNTLICWGGNSNGEADAPAGAFQTVSVGWGHSCGLRADNTITCWGNNWLGQADAPAGAFQTVSVGWGHSCGLRADNTLICWGGNSNGEADAPAGAFQTVSAGGGHSCGLRADNTLICWGHNWLGRADAPAGAFQTVSVGLRHSCGLRADNTITCWGNNDEGQADAPAGAFQTVSVGLRHSCGLRADNTITCWGNNDEGQADAPAGAFQTVSAGSSITPAVTVQPTEPTAESIASSIADAEAHMVSLVNELREDLDIAPLQQHDGLAAVARLWSNTMHENDDFMHNPGWRAEYPAGWVTGGENIGKVSYHGDLISAVERAFDGLSDSPGHYLNMIRPAYGQIGVGIAIGSGFVWVTQNFACYPTDPETRTCGDTAGTADEFSVSPPPDPVPGAPLEAPCMDDSGPGRYIALETYAYSNSSPAYAVRTDGRLICLDDRPDVYGSLAVPSGNFVDITSGSTHYCAQRTDKRLTCWTWVKANRPALGVAPSGTFAAVDAGEFHTCALRTAGSIVCWGLDADGETEAPDGNFKAITAGDRFSCGLRTDSTVACWGVQNT